MENWEIGQIWKVYSEKNSPKFIIVKLLSFNMSHTDLFSAHCWECVVLQNNNYEIALTIGDLKYFHKNVAAQERSFLLKNSSGTVCQNCQKEK